MAGFMRAISRRMRSAGGLYNWGNVLDLYSVVAAAIVERHAVNATDIVHAVTDKLAGDLPSQLLTGSAIIFFLGGEAYYQAFKNDGASNKRFIAAGDLLSGAGAIVLGIGLYKIGQPLLAASSGGLHALSKFGSAASLSNGAKNLLCREFRFAGMVTTTADIIKDMALASRVPALAWCSLSVLSNVMNLPLQDAISHSVMPAYLAWCYTIWGRADWMLSEPRSLFKQGWAMLQHGSKKFAQSPPGFARFVLDDAFSGKAPTAEQQQTLRQAKINRAVGAAGIFGILIANNLTDPDMVKKNWPVFVPLLGKAVWMMAKSMATMASNHAEINVIRHKLKATLPSGSARPAP